MKDIQLHLPTFLCTALIACDIDLHLISHESFSRLLFTSVVRFCLHLLFDGNKIKIARNSEKKQKENPVGCTEEGKIWKENIRQGSREDTTGIVLEGSSQEVAWLYSPYHVLIICNYTKFCARREKNTTDETVEPVTTILVKKQSTIIVTKIVRYPFSLKKRGEWFILRGWQYL